LRCPSIKQVAFSDVTFRRRRSSPDTAVFWLKLKRSRLGLRWLPLGTNPSDVHHAARCGSPDEDIEDAIDDSEALRAFVGIALTRRIVDEIKGHLPGNPVLMHEGAMRPGVRQASLGRAKAGLEQAKASVRAKVEHAAMLKCLFKRRKTRYRGLAKSNAQLFPLFPSANPALARRLIPRPHLRAAF
jgi:hypothetical protein